MAETLFSKLLWLRADDQAMDPVENTAPPPAIDRNVISASLNALVDGFEYALVDHGCLFDFDDM